MQIISSELPSECFASNVKGLLGLNESKSMKSNEYFAEPYKNYVQLSKIDEKDEVGNYVHREIAAHGVGPNLLTPVQVILKEYTSKSRYPDVDYIGEPTTPRPALGRFGNFKGVTSHTGGGIVKQKVEWSKITQNIRRSKIPTFNPSAGVVRTTWSEIDPATINKAKYPYNHVHQSESGHLIEVDDTPGFERLHRYHRTGTFEEIGSLGQRTVSYTHLTLPTKRIV